MCTLFKCFIFSRLFVSLKAPLLHFKVIASLRENCTEFVSAVTKPKTIFMDFSEKGIVSFICKDVACEMDFLNFYSVCVCICVCTCREFVFVFVNASLFVFVEDL